MRILYCGDVVGRAGRDALARELPGLIGDREVDLVIVNGENAAHGFGLTGKICRDFYDLGADVITTGNHAWDQREMLSYIDGDPKVLRPLNYPPGTPGRGAGIFEARSGASVLVAQVMGRLYMDPLDDPFQAIDAALAGCVLGETVDAIVVDVHAEATSEKAAMGVHLDGRVSLVAGTHCHVPTADARLLPGGTAYQTDLGMCGDYDSVIGMKKEAATARFVTKLPTERLEPAEGEGTVCGVLLETGPDGLAASLDPVRLGPHIPNT